ncbi:Gfo/Idh/MocA family protein [Streptomyces sp. NPDC003015]
MREAVGRVAPRRPCHGGVGKGAALVTAVGTPSGVRPASPRSVSGHYWCDYATDPNGPLSRRFKGGAGSGALGDIGSHIIDAAAYVAGPIASVSGASSSTQITKRPLPPRGRALPVRPGRQLLGDAHRLRPARRARLRRSGRGRAGCVAPSLVQP